MKALKIGALAAAIGTLTLVGMAHADSYIRKGSQEIKVVNKNGKLYCTRASDGYEMCNGMTEREDGSWRGKKMKHPDMPRWMSFNGTVVFTNAGLKIKGCAVGMCDSESWSKKK
ncbi:hypothetical protein RXV86_15040 [Alisedimentitalea sp. MJ-SS2]|uniref:hypothetical protein n=1 Tax=Aliisedimentitalea sp. MJ-SS2 TaxID=3049795 RepID=UPI00290DB1E9|nr:hypothetical protein [Alisedimentitalea sp. MJ-SS2]MDU8928705.1 hypothetical protein [Alisedimentitalea sp. MJ-SS2]